MTAGMFLFQTPFAYINGVNYNLVNARAMLTDPGVYTVTFNAYAHILWRGAAGGGGGDNSIGAGTPGSGGGQGAYDTVGEPTYVFPGKVYQITVGYAGPTDVAGGPTTILNVTDSVTIISLTGGLMGQGGSFVGAGGVVLVGANAVNGVDGNPATTGTYGGLKTADVIGPDGNPYAWGGQGLGDQGSPPHFQNGTYGGVGFASIDLIP